MLKKVLSEDEKKPGLEDQVYFQFRVRLEAVLRNRVLHVSTRHAILALLTVPSIYANPIVGL